MSRWLIAIVAVRLYHPVSYGRVTSVERIGVSPRRNGTGYVYAIAFG
jgi:hypothetical protein